MLTTTMLERAVQEVSGLFCGPRDSPRFASPGEARTLAEESLRPTLWDLRASWRRRFLRKSANKLIAVHQNL